MTVPRRLVAQIVTLSLIFIGTGVSQRTEEPFEGGQLVINWEDDQLKEELEALCYNDQWTQAGQLVPGINISNILDTFRSAWHARSFPQVASLVCVQYGPMLNVLSGGFAKTICEPVIEAVHQGREVDVQGICYQLWQIFQHGNGVSFEPPCQRVSSDDKWPSWPPPTPVYDHYPYPDGTRPPWYQHDDDSNDHFDNGDKGDYGSFVWFDFWELKQILDETFSFFGQNSSDFCSKFGAIMFNDSISSFDVVDHALYAIFQSFSYKVYENCIYYDHDGMTGHEPDMATLVLSYLTETNGQEGLCELLQGSDHFEEDITGIAEEATDKMFDVLRNQETCLGLFDTLSPFNDVIFLTTGLQSGELMCDYIISAFEANDKPTELPFGLFPGGNIWNLSVEIDDVFPGEIPFQETITALAQVLNSNTSANGMKLLCSVLLPFLDDEQMNMCSALDKGDYNLFVDSCHSVNTYSDWMFPENDDMYHYPNIGGSHLINNYFQHLYHLQQIASEFNHEIRPHTNVRDYLQSIYNSVPTADYEDTCTVVGNLLYDSELQLKDILFDIIEKDLILLYHIVPHFCQVPLDPGHQWPGEGDFWGDKYPSENQKPEDYDHYETWTYDTPSVMKDKDEATTIDWFFNDDGKRDPDTFDGKKEEMTTEGWYESDWQEYTTDGRKESDHYPPHDHPHDGFDSWWNVHVGPIHGKILEKLLAFLSGYSSEEEFCGHVMESFSTNETLYRMQAMEKVQQMKEKLRSVLEEFDSCMSLVNLLKENMTESELFETSGYSTAEDVCNDIISAFSSKKQDSYSASEFYWPNYNNTFYIFNYDYITSDQLEDGELAPGVPLSSFIHFAGHVYNAPISNGTKLLCHAFGDFMGHFETESCVFLQSSRPKHEFIEYCRGYGTNDDGYYDNHHVHGTGSSFFSVVPWEQLPNSLSEVFGIPFQSEPICHLGWDLFTSQTVKSSLQKGFQVITRLLINATSDAECESDLEYITFFNDTHFVIDYLYDYNESSDKEMNLNFLGLLYSYLGGYDDTVALCTEVKSISEDPEAISYIVEEMTNKLFQIFEHQTECTYFLHTISASLDHNPAGMTVGELVGMEGNEEFCASLVGYMTGETEVSFSASSFVEELTNVTGTSGDELLINSTLTDHILQMVASIYRSDNIREASDIICPLIEMIPDLDPEMELLDACFYLQNVNDTSFNELCTDNLQYYIPYFWIWVNHNSHSREYNDDDHTHHDDHDHGHYDNDDGNDFFSSVSIYTVHRIFSHTFGVPFFDSTIVCNGIDHWLQTTSGADMFSTLFRFFQTVLFSQSFNICPTQYSYMGEPPPKQPDLVFGGTDFIDVVGAVNTFLGNYSDYEYLCWDVQTAYMEWDYNGDSTRMDMILDQLTETFMEVLQDVEQCLALASAMNRMPLVGPVAAQIGFESNEMLCEFVVAQFESTQDVHINYEFLQLLFNDKHGDGEGYSEEEWGNDWGEITTNKWRDEWTQQEEWDHDNEENLGDDTDEMWIKYLRLGIQEMISILSAIYNQDVAITAVHDACVAAHQIASNDSFSMEISLVCEQIGTDGSVLNTCLDDVRDIFDDFEPHYDDFPGATQETATDSMSHWMYLEGVFTKLIHLVGRVYDMYSGFGLNYDRLEQVALNVQKILEISSFDLREPFSSCSLLRHVLIADHIELTEQLINGLAYPIGDFLEYIRQFGLCFIGGTTEGEESTDIVAYRLIRNLLQQFLAFDNTQFCEFTTADHTLDEYRAKGLLIARKVFQIFSNESACEGVIAIVAAEDRYNMLFNLTGADLSVQENRQTFCQHLVSSFSGEMQYLPNEYTLPEGENLTTWEPFSSPGQLLPQLDFTNLTSMLGAVYSSSSLLEGAGVLCTVFRSTLEESDDLGVSFKAVCNAIEAMDVGLVEMQCLNFTVPGYYGDDYPITLRPIDAEGVGLSILLQLFDTTQFTKDSEVCPALDHFFNSDMNPQNVANLILNTWLKALIPTAAGICRSWDEVIWYFSPMRNFEMYYQYTDFAYFSNWTATTDHGVAEAQQFYEHAINTTTILTASILGFPDRESLCDFIQSGINTTTGNVQQDILVTLLDRLSAVFTDAGNCTLVVESILELLSTELHMLPTFYDITGYESPKDFCQMTTDFLSEDGCFAEVDCFGVCGGLARPDCAGTCNGTAKEDCEGVCEGEAVLDCFGACRGVAEADCYGDCEGKAFVSDCTQECVGGNTGKPADSGYDECGLCTLSDDYKDVRDCAGTCDGTASIDECGECTGGETGLAFNQDRIDCSGECDGAAFEDCLGECIVDGETGAVEDACGVCNGPDSACVFSLGLQGMEANVETEITVTGVGFGADLASQCVFESLDETVEVTMSVSDGENGVCSVSLSEGLYTVFVIVGSSPAGGETQTIEVWSSCSEEVDCTGVCGGDAVVDCSGVCGGSTEEDCSGVCGGSLVEDCAGVCGGDTQEDCSGICNGDTPIDCSGTCNGTAQEDCSGVCNGAAFENDCGYCVGGTTGRSESLGYDQCGVCKSDDGYVDSRDCFGTCNGQATVDACGVCVGGETGKSILYSEERIDCRGVCDGTWQLDFCSRCEPDGTSETSKYLDCNNTCNEPGSTAAASTNDCGYCVGGQTNRPSDYGVDACGVCDGSGDSCLGCDGIINSGTEVDACGVCGGTGSSCIVVSSVNRDIVLANEATEVTVSGAGFTTDKVYTCSFSGSETVTSTMTPSGLTSGTCTATLPQSEAYTFTLLADNEAISLAGDATLTVNAIDAIEITSVSPSKPVTSTDPTTFTMRANAGAFTTLKSLDVSPQVNVYRAGSSQLLTTLTASFDEESSNTLTFTHTVTQSIQVVLKPYFDGFGELPGDGLELTVYAPSPQLTSLSFNTLGSAIVADFDSLVNTEVLLECSDILADTAKLGTGAICRWLSPFRLVIVIGSGDNLVSTGDMLTFNRTNIGALFEDYPFPEDANSIIEMTVAAPETIPPVRVTLYGSSVVSSCGRIKGALYSQGAAGRELTNQWTVSSSGDTSAVEGVLAEFTGRTLDLDATLLDAEVDYTFSVIVSNFLGGSGSASLTVQRSARETPDLIISVIGIDRNAYVSDSFALVADIFYSECAPAGDTVFSWTVDNDEVVLSFKRSSRNLLVPPNSLPAGANVTFTVRIYKSSEPDNYVEESITITTAYSNLEAIISQGRFITVGQDNGNLELDGARSNDPNDVALPMTYEWQCEQVTDNTACWSYKSGHTGQSILENAEMIDSTLTFDAAHMDVNKMYMFTLVVRKGVRSASTFIYVIPVAGTPPEISISPVTGSQFSNEILAIQATIRHSSPLSQAVWSTADTDSGSGYVDMTDSSNFIQSPTLESVGSERSFSYFALQRNVLTPGATYNFQLTVTTEDNKTSEAGVEVKVRNIITSCLVSLDTGHSNYTELESIVVAVDSCTSDEDAYPLTYQLFLQISDGSYEARTTAESSDRITITGPPAELTNNNIPYNTFRVKVCDKFGVCANFEVSLRVLAAVFEQTEVNDAVVNLVEVEESRQNYVRALVNFNMLVIRLGDPLVTNSLSTSSRRRRAVDETSATNQKRRGLARQQMDNNDMDTKSAELLISELSKYDPDSSTQDDMEGLVDDFQELVDVFTAGGEPLPDDSSVKMFETLNDIKSRVPSSAGRIREKIDNLTSDTIKTHFRDLTLGGEERKTETSESKIVLKRDIPKARMTFDSNFVIKIASDIISNFSAGWNCSSGSCDGVTFRFKLYNDSVDEYSVTAEDLANRAAAIIEFSLFDPDSDEELVVTNLADTVNFNMTITRPQTGKTYECRFWNTTLSEWSSDGITSEVIDTDVVTCETNHLTTFTVVVVEPLTTVVTTTQQQQSSQASSVEADDQSTSSQMESVSTAATVDTGDVDTGGTNQTESVTADEPSSVDTGETTHTESGKAGNGGSDATEDSSTQGFTPSPSGGGSGVIIGIIVAVVVLIVVVVGMIGVIAFMKMKGGNNKVNSESNFEAAHPVPTTAPPQPVATAMPPAESTVSPKQPETPVAFETAEPVAVPLKAEPDMPAPPSVFVPPGDEGTVVSETEPPHHPHTPEPSAEPEMEASDDSGTPLANDDI